MLNLFILAVFVGLVGYLLCAAGKRVAGNALSSPIDAIPMPLGMGAVFTYQTGKVEEVLISVIGGAFAGLLIYAIGYYRRYSRATK